MWAILMGLFAVQDVRPVDWLWRAVILTLIGLAAQQSGWSLHERFNHNDLYHVVQMAGLYCLYRGALTLNGGPIGSNSGAAERQG